jgi:predicted nucleotidyltransferase
MKYEIVQKLNDLEIDNGITVLYACESGSRAWGFSSIDSDYDIRFIYIRKLSDYITITDKPDTLEFPIVDNLDFSGWDLKKFLQHIYKSNGVMFEWLQSPIIYYAKDTFVSDNLNLSRAHFRAKPTLYHYLGLTKRTFWDIKETDKVKIKRYFYAIRPILAAKYIIDNNEIPPMTIQSLMDTVKGISDLRTMIEDLMAEKETQEESFLIKRIPEIDNYIENEIIRITGIAERLPDNKLSSDLINEYLYNVLASNK